MCRGKITANVPAACRSVAIKSTNVFTLIQKQMNSTKDQIKHSTATDGKPTVVCRYYHPCVGYGDFVREYNGRYGLGLIIKLDNGREWFAPINEFRRVR